MKFVNLGFHIGDLLPDMKALIYSLIFFELISRQRF